jgi:chemotaxis protein methyltransferase CheR
MRRHATPACPDAAAALTSEVDEVVLARLANMVEEDSGIELRPEKRFVVMARLTQRLKELKLGSLHAYFRLVSSDAAERQIMVHRLCVHETRFFREDAHFKFVRDGLVPQWRSAADAGLRSRQIRAWSAACSSGEEPFSLAMLLLSLLPPESGWQISVFASDLSPEILQQASGATWPEARAADIPVELRRRFLLRGVGSRAGTVRAAPELRALMTFAQLNLMAPEFPRIGPFDLIFLRNVLIYFSAATKQKVVGRVLDQLNPHGHLIVGHADSLNHVTRRVRSVGPTIYAFPPRTR